MSYFGLMMVVLQPKHVAYNLNYKVKYLYIIEAQRDGSY